MLTTLLDVLRHAILMMQYAKRRTIAMLQAGKGLFRWAILSYPPVNRTDIRVRKKDYLTVLWLMEEAREFRSSFNFDELLDYAGLLLIAEATNPGSAETLARQTRTKDLYLYLTYVTSRYTDPLYKNKIDKACNRWMRKQALRGRQPIFIKTNLFNLINKQNYEESK